MKRPLKAKPIIRLARMKAKRVIRISKLALGDNYPVLKRGMTFSV